MTLEVPITTDADAVSAGETVLVVDDSRAHRRLMTRTLERWGYRAVEADSGEHALEVCRTQDISLVVSDWMMPGISGVEFCRLYRKLFTDRPGYFILLTAQTEREALAEGLESGADDFLSKPVSSIELHARLRAGERVLNAQRALASKNDELTTTLERLSDAYSAIDRDLREARLFQEALMPDRHVPLAGMDVSLLYQPSGHVGGDMVGYFPIRDGELGVYAVDVSGHGVSSALMTARIASYFSGAAPDRNLALTPTADGYEMIAPDEVCRRLNALLQKDAESDQYLTMVLARVSTRTGEVTMCQAGHPSPLILRTDGGMEFHESFGMPVGLVDDAEYQSSTIRLGHGDRLLVFSDGLTECPDAAGNLLDEDGLIRILGELSGLRGQELLTGLVEALTSFSGRRDFPDDLSALLVERH
jgi:sigma-B regulation protein RsbU (phosphoserine phosphatase)